MKKLFTLAVLLVFIGAAAEVSAQKWRKYLDVYKELTVPLSIPIYEFNKNGVCGKPDSAILFNSANQAIQTFRGKNLFRPTGTEIFPIGNVSFEDNRSYVNDLQKIDGKLYICANNFNTGLLENRLKYLSNDQFIPEESIKFDGTFKLHYLGNGIAFVFGDYFNGQDKNGIKQLDGGSIWDIKSQTLNKVEGTGPDNPGLGGQYYDHSVGLDNSLYIVVGGAIRIMHYGSIEWKDSEYETVIVGGQFRKVLALSKNNAYAIWERFSDKASFVLHLVNRKWESIGEISYPDPTTQAVTSMDFIVSSLQHYKGKLIMSHTGSQVNGKAAGPIIVYDTTTKAWSSLPVPSTLGSRSKFGESYVKVVGDSIYLIQNNSSLIFGVQTVWLLEHDGLLPVTLKNFSGVVGVSGMHQLSWETVNEINFSHFDVESSTDGQQFKMVTKVPARGSGTYTASIKGVGKVYYRLKQYDKDGVFFYSKVIPVGVPLDIFWVQNPVGSTLKIMGPVEKTVQLGIYTMSGQLLSTQNVQGMREIAFPYPRGMYIIIFLSGNERKTQKILF